MDFKLAFPHLAGLAISERPAEDYYFYPWGGGIIADVPAHIRRGYGDHEALYQVMDLFSPARGGGFYVRLDDAEGWHKTLALRKQEQRTLPLGRSGPPDASHILDVPPASRPETDAQRLFVKTTEEFQWTTSSLAAVEGTGFACEYLRRTREPGQAFAPAAAVLAAHPGSSLGPWSTPFDRLQDVLTEAQIKEWQGYFVKDPITGQTMWNNQPGDYDGYNQRFGGLPAFRQAVQICRERGALVTLYTDPFRLDDASRTGREFGKRWGVVGPDGKPTTAYEVWNPCHDVVEVRRWVADTMQRVMRETGADGLRLDEYGHAGWVCFSPDHQHTFAERGVSQWQKAVAEATRLVREGMDKVAPGSVLTTEHPGYDYLLQFLEGCITYDVTVMASPLRPVECNLQRFYFPECKAYELDHRNADPACRKKFWNAVESFGRYYPLPMYAILKENEDAYQGRDCVPLSTTPGQAPYVYVNRFGSADKTLYHVYNATGHTFDGRVLTMPLQPDEHVFDLLQCREVAVNQTASPAPAEVQVYLPRDDVACLARLPRQLRVSRDGETLSIEAKLPAAGCQLVVTSSTGERLLTQDAKPGQNQIALGQLREASKACCVKLLGGDALLDVTVIPGP